MAGAVLLHRSMSPAGLREGGGGNSGHVLHARTYSISTATMDSDWMGHMI